jgi:hypothetical protein
MRLAARRHADLTPRGTPVQARIDDVRLDLDDALLQARADARDVVVRGRSDDK